MRTVLICYDVAQPRRLQKVAKLLEGFGTRLQRSVFLCHLREADFERLHARLDALVEPEEDRVAIFPLCPRCRAACEGVAKPEQAILYMV